MVQLSSVKAFGYIVVALTTLAAPVSAQRGQPQNGLDGPAETATSGMPGLFDTQVPGEGQVTIALPTLQADVGITDRWSLGTNAAAPVVGAAAGVLALGIRTRYLVFHSAEASLTVDGNGFLYRERPTYLDPLTLRNTKGTDLQYGGMLSSNFLWRVRPKHEIQATFGYAGLRQQQEQGPFLSSDDFVGSIAFAVGYQANLDPAWALQLTFASIPSLSQVSDGTAAFGVLELGDGNFLERSVFRGMLYHRVSETWLFEAGLYVPPAILPIVLPWLGLTARVP